MAIQVNNVILRNLQEQVEKNKQDIAKHYEIDRVLSDWGIKVLGVVNTPSDIPEGIYEYGDAYGVRTGSGIVYYVWTRANINVGQEEDYWLDIGALSIIGPTGPQGLQGPQGIQGVRGSTWVSSTSAPSTSQLGNNGDQWLDTSNGDVYQKNSNGWTRTGNIRGPQGIQGPTGAQGIQGIQGPTGAQGPKGDTGSSFTIGGLLQSTDNLPTPTAANRSVGYAVRNQDGVTYDLYVVVGIDNLQWVNMGRVEGVEGPQGPVGPQGPAGADIQIVTITGIPSTATQGTLTQEQVQTLLDHPGNYIQFNNENFYPQDVETDEGYIVYSHVGMFEGNTKIKTITLTIATGGWVLTETNLQEKLTSGTNIKTINNQSILGSGNITIEGGGSGGGEEPTYIDITLTGIMGTQAIYIENQSIQLNDNQKNIIKNANNVVIRCNINIDFVGLPTIVQLFLYKNKSNFNIEGLGNLNTDVFIGFGMLNMADGGFMQVGIKANIIYSDSDNYALELQNDLKHYTLPITSVVLPNNNILDLTNYIGINVDTLRTFEVLKIYCVLNGLTRTVILNKAYSTGSITYQYIGTRLDLGTPVLEMIELTINNNNEVSLRSKVYSLQ